MASRALWKGAITFGLVHIPVALHSATGDSGLDFDWLDKRTLDPVGYKRINKKTGKEISRENIVKGIQYHKGEYIVLSDQEIADAYPKATQSIEIESFVAGSDIPFIYLDRPYYLAPINKGKKVYALLRDALLDTQQVGIARVVIHTKQHLAVLVPSGPGLVLNLLRWGEDIRSWEDLDLPAEGAKAAGLSDRELNMAKQLIKDMSDKWDPQAHSDSFKREIMALVERKVKEGKLEAVEQPADLSQHAAGGAGAQVIDLTELLQRSLRKGAGTGGDEHKAKPPGKTASPKSASKKAGLPAAAKRRTA